MRPAAPQLPVAPRFHDCDFGPSSGTRSPIALDVVRSWGMTEEGDLPLGDPSAPPNPNPISGPGQQVKHAYTCIVPAVGTGVTLNDRVYMAHKIADNCYDRFREHIRDAVLKDARCISLNLDLFVRPDIEPPKDGGATIVIN